PPSSKFNSVLSRRRQIGIANAAQLIANRARAHMKKIIEHNRRGQAAAIFLKKLLLAAGFQAQYAVKGVIGKHREHRHDQHRHQNFHQGKALRQRTLNDSAALTTGVAKESHRVKNAANEPEADSSPDSIL